MRIISDGRNCQDPSDITFLESPRWVREDYGRHFKHFSLSLSLGAILGSVRALSLTLSLYYFFFKFVGAELS